MSDHLDEKLIRTASGNYAKDLTGVRFGRFTALRLAPKAGRNTKWECVCDCGSLTTVTYVNLRYGASKSCGCLKGDGFSAHRSHGMVNSREYHSWSGAKARCLNPKDVGFKNYGGRGISICAEWVTSFECFYRDMGPCPDGYSIERKDVNGNYCPDNCTWADGETQVNNTRRTVRLTLNGRTQSQSQWAKEIGIARTTIYERRKAGLPVESILSKLRARTARIFLNEQEMAELRGQLGLGVTA